MEPHYILLVEGMPVEERDKFFRGLMHSLAASRTEFVPPYEWHLRGVTAQEARALVDSQLSERGPSGDHSPMHLANRLVEVEYVPSKAERLGADSPGADDGGPWWRVNVAGIPVATYGNRAPAEHHGATWRLHLIEHLARWLSKAPGPRRCEHKGPTDTKACGATLVQCDLCGKEWCLDHQASPLVCPGCGRRPVGSRPTTSGATDPAATDPAATDPAATDPAAREASDE